MYLYTILIVVLFYVLLWTVEWLFPYPRFCDLYMIYGKWMMMMKNTNICSHISLTKKVHVVDYYYANFIIIHTICICHLSKTNKSQWTMAYHLEFVPSAEKCNGLLSAFYVWVELYLYPISVPSWQVTGGLYLLHALISPQMWNSTL